MYSVALGVTFNFVCDVVYISDRFCFAHLNTAGVSGSLTLNYNVEDTYSAVESV